MVVVVLVIYGCTHYELDDINHTVNRYGYMSDEEYGQHGFHLMTPNQRGDCEDFAYTKCLMIKALYPDKATYLLFRSGNPAHAALAVDGMVLDNQYGLIYPYRETEWDSARYWDCVNTVLKAKPRQR